MRNGMCACAHRLEWLENGLKWIKYIHRDANWHSDFYHNESFKANANGIYFVRISSTTMLRDFYIVAHIFSPILFVKTTFCASMPTEMHWIEFEWAPRLRTPIIVSKQMRNLKKTLNEASSFYSRKKRHWNYVHC